MLIRRELPEDRPAIESVVHRAFAKDGDTPVEVTLTQQLFVDSGYIPELSLVAVEDDTIVGFVIGTRGHIGEHDAVGLGPLAVLPEFQGRGVGKALVWAITGAAEALHESTLVLLGEPAYYSRFGFTAATDVGIESPEPEWGEFFQARRLTEYGANGAFAYASPFDAL